MIDILVFASAGAGGLALYELILRALDSHRARTEQRQRAEDRAAAQLALRRARSAPLYGQRRLSVKAWYVAGDRGDENPTN